MVLDGMHRVEALRRFDCRFTCVYLAGYMSPEIKVDRWCRVVSIPIDTIEFGKMFGEFEVITEIGSIPGRRSSLLVVLEDGYFQPTFSGLGMLSLLNQVASIEAWLSENDLDVCYETETDAAGLIERREIGFVLRPPEIQKRHVIEAAGRDFGPPLDPHRVEETVAVLVVLNALRDDRAVVPSVVFAVRIDSLQSREYHFLWLT